MGGETHPSPWPKWDSSSSVPLPASLHKDDSFQINDLTSTPVSESASGRNNLRWLVGICPANTPPSPLLGGGSPDLVLRSCAFTQVPDQTHKTPPSSHCGWASVPNQTHCWNRRSKPIGAKMNMQEPPCDWGVLMWSPWSPLCLLAPGLATDSVPFQAGSGWLFRLPFSSECYTACFGYAASVSL